MAIRYTDLDATASEAKDFAVRKRKPGIPYLALFFIFAAAVAIGTVVAIDNRLTLSILLAVLLGTVGWYAVIQIQRNRDLVLATEFQNALFASALGLNHKFCLIIKRDGNIIYLDRSFQHMFPEFLNKTRRTIDSLLDHAKVPEEESKKIFDAIERGTYDKALFNIRDAQGNFHYIIMSIEPILRPSGFILLRGREYVEKRNAGDLATSPSPAALNKPTITLFSHVMDSMQIGVYMASPTGQIIYVNPLLEQWLGFQDDELASGSLMLQDMVYQRSKQPVPTDPGDFEGEIGLQKKTGGQLKVFVNQKIIRDHQGKPIGCTAMVHNISESASSKKAANDSGF